MDKELEKIALVVIRYGNSIDGGAEVHCRMLAEHLKPFYQVEVLTTCIKNYKTGVNEFPEGIEWINGVKVNRFKAQPIERENEGLFHDKAKIGRKIRRFLYRLHLLKWLSNIIPIWNLNKSNEIRYLKSTNFFSPNMLDFINSRESDYKAFIFLTYAYPLAIFGTDQIGSKSIFIPTAHKESALFFSVFTHLFNRFAHIAFNTEAEKRLCVSVFGKALAKNSIVGIGIETTVPEEWQLVKEKYNLPDNYLLYLGRVDSGKINTLTDFFLSYIRTYRSDIKLVLTGGIHTQKVENESIIYTGFVSEAEKMSILKNATVVINPSKYESLSLILLEAMWFKRPVLVNGQCSVLKDHCKLSNGASLFYSNSSTFNKTLHTILSSKTLQAEMGEKGKLYVEKNYNWNVITNKFKSIIESL